MVRYWYCECVNLNKVDSVTRPPSNHHDKVSHRGENATSASDNWAPPKLGVTGLGRTPITGWKSLLPRRSKL